MPSNIPHTLQPSRWIVQWASPNANGRIETSYSNSISDSMSIDATIETSMKASMFSLFETEIGVSATTGKKI